MDGWTCQDGRAQRRNTPSCRAITGATPRHACVTGDLAQIFAATFREETDMKKLILSSALVFGAGMALADPVEGVWQTQTDDGSYAHVTIAPCGGAFCGVISRTYKDGAEYKSENIGRQIVIDMVSQGDGTYDGQVWRPSNNKIYVGGIQLNGDSMKLAGCVAGGLICKKQSWARLK